MYEKVHETVLAWSQGAQIEFLKQNIEVNNLETPSLVQYLLDKNFYFFHFRTLYSEWSNIAVFQSDVCNIQAFSKYVDTPYGRKMDTLYGEGGQ